MHLNFAQKLTLMLASVIGTTGVGVGVSYVKLTDAEALSTHALERAYPASQLAARLKLDMVQVQQWLTDISATRGAKGFDDGYAEAATYAKDFEATRLELKALLPDTSNALDLLKADFDQFYAVGQKMAASYIKGGPTTGNPFMETFDPFAAKISASVDEIVNDVNTRFESTLTESNAGQSAAKLFLFISFVLTALLALLTGGVFVKRVTTTLRSTRDAALAIAEGDLTYAAIIPDTNDELGEVARAFEKMRLNLVTLVGGIQDNSTALAAQSDELEATSGLMTEQADGVSTCSGDMKAGTERISTRMQEVREAGEQISEGATALAKTAGDLNTGAQRVAEGADELASNTDMVAAATEEISSSVEEISRSCVNAAGISGHSAEQAIAAQTEMTQLQIVAKEIIGVVEMIRDVAKRTDILALNATIEAAGAGEAGKGFAVVAREVKELAKATTTSIEHIGDQVTRVQASVERCAEFISELNESVSEVDAVMQSIATATAQQSASVMEVSENVNRSASTAQDISRQVRDMVGHIESVHTQAAEIDEHIEQRILGSISAATVEIDELSDAATTLSTMAGDAAGGASEARVVAGDLARLAASLDSSVSNLTI